MHSRTSEFIVISLLSGMIFPWDILRYGTIVAFNKVKIYVILHAVWPILT